ncbi:dihydrofolate reductase-like domain-containing protein [Baffinella frigidus]|nr:dihydrofolate reductase-like domain-containing protein [Cryptophyta sp. CCMP2293]
MNGASAGGARPVVTLKIALDQQGAVDDLGAVAKRFTSPASLDAVHRLRLACDAVLVGVGTVLRDNPSLTVRRVPLPAGTPQPTRVVMDPSLRTPATAILATDGLPTLLVCSASALPPPVLPPFRFALPECMLCRAGIRHVMVEGGPSTARSFLAARLVDRCG